MPIATRLSTAGTLLVNGSFDENTSIAPSKFRTTSNTVYAGTLDEFTGAPVVDSSLKLWLDAGQTASYSGSGTTWTDLSGNANNGTLVNSPTFISNDGGGCIQLDGSNDHITLPVTGFAPASLTIDYWIKRISDNGYFWIIDNSDQPELRMLFQAGKLQIYFYDDGAYSSTSLSSTTFSTGSWYNITVTMTNGSQNVYINGNQEIITTTGVYTGNASGNAGEHTLGTYNRPGVGYGGYANVRIGSYRFYNRVLTAGEITQNYNALQSRYGLASITATQMPVVQRQQSSGTLLINGEFDEFTGAPIVDSSLVLWLDAAQTTSYPGTGTTWTDLSGNGNNGTLTSGPTYNASNGGSIRFNGNGSGNYVSASDSVSLRPTNITVCTWAKFNSFNSTNTGVIVKPQNSTVGGGWTNPYLSWMIRVEGTGTIFDVSIGSSSVYYPAGSAYSFSTNTWYLLTLTYDGTNLKGYVNTSLISSSSPGAVINYTVNPIQIGAMNSSLEYLNGYVSDTMIYNRALTADEITTNFNALRGRYGI